MKKMVTPRSNVRFPSDDEINDFLDDALPLALKEATKQGLELEAWMVADAICMICPEIEKCDRQLFEEAVIRVLRKRQLI